MRGCDGTRKTKGKRLKGFVKDGDSLLKKHIKSRVSDLSSCVARANRGAYARFAMNRSAMVTADA